ncbi:hypothetical protein [Actinoplanes solisilvae]|uniref:hypothetical protein n=1 Tax=Actinoplanes solisilvae TaxID=2486853 RepID=UPI000FD8F326|nr:hypothetical protein [Actinoplanes solisilvae]
MRKSVTRAVLGLTATVAALGFAASPAAAAPDSPSGLTFYAGTFTKPVLNVADPDGACTAFPAKADSLVGWSNVTTVLAYRTADCTGQATGLGTLRTFGAGEFKSFSAF